MVDPLTVASGFGVGVLVGLTGVGGGSLMTPVLVLIFGVQVTTAVGTDLLYAAATKAVGIAVHQSGGTVDWRIVRRLAVGSVPATMLTLMTMATLGIGGGQTASVITIVLGICLIATAVCVLLQRLIARYAAGRLERRSPEWTRGCTIACGFVLGALVSLTSVGAGAIGMTALILLYPDVPVSRLVGSDIAHAVPLTLIAGIGHWWLGSVDWPLLGMLLVGSTPGVILGSRLAARVPAPILRPILAATLVAVGVRMLA